MNYDRAEAGVRLRQLRKNRFRLTGVALAEQLGVSQSFLSDVERGQSGFSAPLLVGLADRFEVNIAWLFTGRGRPVLDGDDVDVLEPGESEALADELREIAFAISQQPHVAKLIGPALGSGDYEAVPTEDQALANLFTKARALHSRHGDAFLRRFREQLELLALAMSAEKEPQPRRNAS